MLITCFMVHHTAVSLSVSYIHIVFWMLSLAECWPVCFLVGLFPSPLIAWCQRVKLWARQWCSTPESLLLRTLYNTTCRVSSLFPLTYQLTVCPFALTLLIHRDSSHHWCCLQSHLISTTGYYWFCWVRWWRSMEVSSKDLSYNFHSVFTPVISPTRWNELELTAGRHLKYQQWSFLVSKAGSSFRLV